MIELRAHIPSEFSRQPRPLLELDYWKATEFRQFLLYTGPIVLLNVLSKDMYTHFLSLSVAMSILLNENDTFRNKYVVFAGELLNFFVNNCQFYYLQTYIYMCTT